MRLDYLDFDGSEDSEGGASFDALASVPASRWPALAAEAAAVLSWAHAEFGAPAALDEGGGWDFALQGSEERAAPLELHWEPSGAGLQAQVGAGTAEPRRTLGLTLSCVPALADAFRRALLA